MDVQLRKSERLAVQGGEQAKRRLLVQRVRAGALSLERLGLAAYLGDEAAASACEAPAPRALDAWLDGLVAVDKETSVRAGLALAHAVREGRRALPDRPEFGVRNGLSQVETWCRDATHTPALGTLAEARHAALTSSGVDETLGWMSVALVEAILAEDDETVASHAGEALRLGLRLLDEDAVRSAIRAALIPWAVGDADPLRA